MMILLSLWLILSSSAAAPLLSNVDKEATEEDLGTDDIASVGIVNSDGMDSDGLHNHTSQNTSRDAKHIFYGGDINFSGTIHSTGDHASINIGSISSNAASQGPHDEPDPRGPYDEPDPQGPHDEPDPQDFAAPDQICKGILRLVANETLDNEFNSGTGWYGKHESSKGQFVSNPDGFTATDYDESNGACVPQSRQVQCHQSKGKINCNEAHTCSELLAIKEKLVAGGYNCFGRHERTYWHQVYGESGCKASANCVSASAVPAEPSWSFATPSRYLAPWGYKASYVSANAFESLGLRANDKGGEFASSPFPRCADGLALLAAGNSSGISMLSTTTGEKLMYVGSLRENVQRKGFCTNLTNDSGISKRGVNMYVFDEMRKLAGTPPAAGKNNWYMTHGTNMKGAFGVAIDEGYWMCLKPDVTKPFPKVKNSYVTSHTICTEPVAGLATATVDFSDNVFQFGTDFLLSSESLYLMDRCSALETAPPTNSVGAPLSVFARDTQVPKLVLTEAEVGSTVAFKKLLDIQKHALSFVPHAHGNNATVFHLGLWVHNNGGYKYPATVHTPFRRILEDTISGDENRNSNGNAVSKVDQDKLYARRFAIAEAIISAGDNAKYTECNATSTYPYATTVAIIKQCYEQQFNKGVGWYWGGKEKALINSVQDDFVPTSAGGKLYGSVNEWQGARKWFVNEYVSGYVEAGACLVQGGIIQLGALLESLGCSLDLNKSAGSAN